MTSYPHTIIDKKGVSPTLYPPTLRVGGEVGVGVYRSRQREPHLLARAVGDMRQPAAYVLQQSAGEQPVRVENHLRLLARAVQRATS